MNACVVYDCLYPHTVGGAERWYRNLSERLAAEGHEVTYLTLRQWTRDAEPRVTGVAVRAVGPRFELYRRGRRRTLPPLVFGMGVLVHLLARGRRYDVVHMASFPYFSVLAAAAARRIQGFELIVDWHEVWSKEYWHDYLGKAGGMVGWLVQRSCARVRQRAFCFSRLHAGRLRASGLRGPVTVLRGQYAESPTPTGDEGREPLIVFAGRHIPEKRVCTIVPALARARQQAPDLRAEIYGDGPDRHKLASLVREERLSDVVSVPGFVDASDVDAALRRALCMVLPSVREGYGRIVVEAAARGTPSVVVRAPDNAATELVEDGVNGVIASSAEPGDLGRAILRVHDSAPELRASTRAWFKRNARDLSLTNSLDIVTRCYREG